MRELQFQFMASLSGHYKINQMICSDTLYFDYPNHFFFLELLLNLFLIFQFLLINYIFINMNQQRKIRYPTQAIAHNGLISSPITDLFQTFPYSMYPPYWPLQYFGIPDQMELNRLNHYRCGQCRPISYKSVKTQTQVQVEPQQSIKSHKQVSQLAVNDLKDNILERSSSNKIPFQVKEEINSDSYQINLSAADKQQNQPSEQEQEEQSQSNSSSHEEEVEKQRESICHIKQGVLKNMLKHYNISPSAYQSQIAQILAGSSLETQLIKFFHEKVYTFKKSKQEMIKLIIRKTQRHYKVQFNCKKDDRFKKFGGYKSMNSVYLEKLFSDSCFVKSYIEVINSFIEEFQQQNNQKLRVFLEKIHSASTQQQFKVMMKMLDEKNKMPWPAFWIQKMKKVIFELRNSYINHGTIEISLKGKRKGS